MDKLSFGAGFAEIEVDFGAGNTAPAQSVGLAQPIGARAADPIREKFYQMRSLADRNPFARSDAGLFYKQAKFMEDFSDSYPGNAQFFMYYPAYQHMGYEQLRTYFTWRTKVRRGVILPTSLSYVFLYVYELLSGVGAQDPADGLERLWALWSAYRDWDAKVDEYLPRWLKDYCIYYPLPRSFTDFVAEHGLQGYYPELFLFDLGAENSLALWNGISSYDVTKSKFCGAGNAALLEDCFAFVRRRLPISDLLIYGVSRGVVWRPFEGALFYPSLRQPDRRAELPGGEVYTCRDNCWTADLTLRYAGRGELAGYLIKKTEACLREAVKFKFRLTADPGALRQALPRLTKLGLPPAELDRAIENAVAEFLRRKARTVVTVDHGNLARIREEALETQNQLLVPEEDEPFVPPPPEAPAAPTLREALSEQEREALATALCGGVMSEILADSINEKAMDLFGDTLMDADRTIYEEYRDKVAEMVG